jgi:hypothetical protein
MNIQLPAIFISIGAGVEFGSALVPELSWRKTFSAKPAGGESIGIVIGPSVVISIPGIDCSGCGGCASCANTGKANLNARTASKAKLHLKRMTSPFAIDHHEKIAKAQQRARNLT